MGGWMIDGWMGMDGPDRRIRYIDARKWHRIDIASLVLGNNLSDNNRD